MTAYARVKGIHLKGIQMKRSLTNVVLSLALALSVCSSTALSFESAAHRAAVRVCKQRYKAAIKGLKRLRSRDTRLRMEQARRERRECIELAPK
jgi:hypothetical protein